MNAPTSVDRSAARPADWIVLERHGTWAQALRRVLGPAIALQETRTPTACVQAALQHHGCLVAIELTAATIERTATLLARVGERSPTSLPLVLADRTAAHCESWMREAGAAHFITSVRQLAPLGEIAARHARRFPPPEPLLAEKIWRSLPWGQ